MLKIEGEKFGKLAQTKQVIVEGFCSSSIQEFSGFRFGTFGCLWNLRVIKSTIVCRPLMTLEDYMNWMYYRTRIKFLGYNFCVLVGKKIRGILIFVAMVEW